MQTVGWTFFYVVHHIIIIIIFSFIKIKIVTKLSGLSAYYLIKIRYITSQTLKVKIKKYIRLIWLNLVFCCIYKWVLCYYGILRWFMGVILLNILEYIESSVWMQTAAWTFFYVVHYKFYKKKGQYQINFKLVFKSDLNKIGHEQDMETYPKLKLGICSLRRIYIWTIHFILNYIHSLYSIY